ncbi:MAG: alpha/beta hydrolase [Roseburia sp.]
MEKKVTTKGKNHIWKKILIVLIVIIAEIIAAFGIYVANYYHATDITFAEEENITKVEYDNYIVYGDSTEGTAFIFYPGGKVEAEAYEPILCEIVKGGGCAILVKMPFHLAIFNPDAADCIMQDFPQIEHWYIGGHSLGGAMAADYAAEHAEKLEGLILFAAYPTKEISEDLFVLSLYGSEDKILNIEKYLDSKELAPQMFEVVIQGGNHAQFGNYGEQKGDGTASISEIEQWETAADYVIASIQQNQ